MEIGGECTVPPTRNLVLEQKHKSESSADSEACVGDVNVALSQEAERSEEDT